MTTSQAPTALPTASKVLCAVYGAIAIAALIATWSQGLAYLHSLSGQLDFWVDTKVNAASRFLTADILLFYLAAVVFMVIEARKHQIKFVWAYILGGALIAISVTFPLFLIARQLRIGNTDPLRVRAIDMALVAVFAIAVLGLVIWVDMG